MLGSTAQATDIIFKAKAATTLNPVTLYADSSFTAQTKTFFKGGFLFEVLGETRNAHEDAAQNQKFKWFKVRSEDGQSGWIFGDGLAVIAPDDEISENLKAFHKKKLSFNNGFEHAVVWIAKIEGRDNFHDQDYLNPAYEEKYIVITNEHGRSVHLNVGGLNARGKFDLKQAQLYDVTGDGISEILIQTKSFPVGSAVENRNFEIHGFQGGSLVKLFEERMSLTYADDVPSPALFKHIEVSGKTIRVGFVDYVSCSNYSLGIKYDPINNNMERCLEYVTYTVQWDHRTKQYQPIYEESRTPIKAGVRFGGVQLKDRPSMGIDAKNLLTIQRNDKLTVIKHHEQFNRIGGVKKAEAFFYVKHPNGKYGYVKADKLGFIDSEHSELLLDYYTETPLSKSSWKSDALFLKLLPATETAVSKK